MNLHRSGEVPDWEAIPASEHNRWQKIAAKTKGFVTLGNVVTLVGAKLVLSGLSDVKKGKTRRGAAKITVGRVGGDLGDGLAADKTGTKSPFGAALDPTADKLLILASVPTLVREGLLPAHAAGLILAQNAGSAGETARSVKHGVKLNVSQEGKYKMAADWGVMALFAGGFIAHKFGKHNLGDNLNQAGEDLLIAALPLGILAVAGYHNDINKALAAPHVDKQE